MEKNITLPIDQEYEELQINPMIILIVFLSGSFIIFLIIYFISIYVRTPIYLNLGKQNTLSNSLVKLINKLKPILNSFRIHDDKIELNPCSSTIAQHREEFFGSLDMFKEFVQTRIEINEFMSNKNPNRSLILSLVKESDDIISKIIQAYNVGDLFTKEISGEIKKLEKIYSKDMQPI